MEGSLAELQGVEVGLQEAVDAAHGLGDQVDHLLHAQLAQQRAARQRRAHVPLRVLRMRPFLLLNSCFHGLMSIRV